MNFKKCYMCLNNYIGVRGCSDEEPESGLYINDIPGITTRLAANIVDSEIISGEQLLKNIVNRAYLSVIDDIVTGIAKYGYSWLPQQILYGMTAAESTKIWAAGKEFTITLDVCDIQRARLAKVKVNAVAGGSITINGEVYAVEAGVSEIEIYEDVTSVVVSADVDLYTWLTNYSCSVCFYENTPIDLELSVICDKCKLATIYRDSLKNAFLQKAGILFYQYALTTEQTSQEARHAQSIAGRMLAQLKGGIDKDGIQFEGEYKQEIEGVIHMFKNIATKYPCCFECKGYTLSYTKL